MKPINRFKSEIGEDYYKQKVKEFAALKSVEAAVKTCDTCGQIQFCHDSGPCTRSANSESDKLSKFDINQLTEIKSSINRDIIDEIIRLERFGAATGGEANFNDRLASALDKISAVLDQNQPRPSQITKVKVPPTWAKETFADYKKEVEALENAHPGDTFSKYSELLTD